MMPLSAVRFSATKAQAPARDVPPTCSDILDSVDQDIRAINGAGVSAKAVDTVKAANGTLAMAQQQLMTMGHIDKALQVLATRAQLLLHKPLPERLERVTASQLDLQPTEWGLLLSRLLARLVQKAQSSPDGLPEGIFQKDVVHTNTLGPRPVIKQALQAYRRYLVQEAQMVDALLQPRPVAIAQG